MDTIKCCLCQEKKNIDDFGKRKDSANKRKYFCKKCDSKRKRKWESENPEKVKLMAENQKFKKFGITRDDYYLMFKNQNGVCAICNQPETMINKLGNTNMLAVDHCHVNNYVRGLLCSKCNVAIGLFKEDIENLKSAILYLQKK